MIFHGGKELNYSYVLCIYDEKRKEVKNPLSERKTELQNKDENLCFTKSLFSQQLSVRPPKTLPYLLER